MDQKPSGPEELKGRKAETALPELLSSDRDVSPPIQSAAARSSSDETHTHTSRLVFAYLRKPKPLPSRARARWIVVSLYVIMTLAGWDTGASAPLLPFLQRYYNINYLIMSMIYVTTFAGNLIAAALNVYLTDRLGFGLVSSLGTVCFALGYAISSSGPPYPVFAISFALNGLGFGFQDAQINSLTARLPNPTAKMSLLHAFFGLGGMVAPFISTPFVQHFPERPTLLYTICLAVALITLAIEIVVFRGQTEEQLTGRKDGDGDGTAEREREVPERGLESAAVPLGDMKSLDIHAAAAEGVLAPAQGVLAPAHGDTLRPGADLAGQLEERERNAQESSGRKMVRIVKSPAVWVFVMHSFLYVGVENTLGGWSPTYLITVRGADSNAGYVTSGFWGGLTVGRVVLIPLTKRLGNRWSVFAYSGAALALQILTWVIPNYLCSAVCICFTGFFLAPIFPAAIVMITEIIPDELHVGVIGLFGTIGGAGAAGVPFILGAVADKYGFWVMAPFMVTGLALSMILWAFIPRHSRA